MPKSIQVREQTQTGIKISYVILAPLPSLKAIIVVGIILKQAVPSMHSIIISFVAYSFFMPLSILEIAFIASGVTAFETPSKLALMQAVISSVAVSFLNERGNISLNKGLKSLDNPLIILLSFSISIIPFHSAITPTRDMQTVTLFSHPSKILLLTSAIFPQKIAKINDIMHSNAKHFPSINAPFIKK